ncbi:MAG: hypothetical protein Q7S58_03895 [Candidatus Binatus sp.]|uniref:hypothetical protein n=1 Tax=Candidatus Binatus sp. TaxID=2811406 RepID=UPI0027282589|nr:hypothetical protein [Candidatus Binatus sp.]MDO8431533.1 hypothetical protein [Candidatus Binatus sp.]
MIGARFPLVASDLSGGKKSATLLKNNADSLAFKLFVCYKEGERTNRYLDAFKSLGVAAA